MPSKLYLRAPVMIRNIEIEPQISKTEHVSKTTAELSTKSREQ